MHWIASDEAGRLAKWSATRLHPSGKTGVVHGKQGQLKHVLSLYEQ